MGEALTMTMDEAAVLYGLEPNHGRWIREMALRYQIPLNLGPKGQKRITRRNFERLVDCLQVGDGSVTPPVVLAQSARSKARRRKAVAA